MSVIMGCGFQSVDMQGFRKKSVSKGVKLVASFHVKDVTETIDSNSRFLQGFIIPKTRVNNPRYHIKIELDENRIVKTSTCSCKAGKARCKHIAAVCVFVNKENVWSKTNEPLVWNKPSETQSQKYSKGARIKALYSIDQSSTGEIPKKITVDCINNIPENLPEINCPFFSGIKIERSCKAERDKFIADELKKRGELLLVVDFLEKFQHASTPYHAYVSSLDPDNENRVRLKRLLCPEDLKETFAKVQVDDDKWREICVESSSQSQSVLWFQERYLRVTCSSKAYQIKTRQANFDRLAQQFKNQKQGGGGAMTDGMKYGLKTESVAREAFEAETGMKVHEVGLVISKRQPFLACSPDGIIAEKKALLEIKCPHTCENLHIVDRKAKKSNVSYLHFEVDGEILLDKTKDYYTQIQTSLYILGVTKCYLYVYSRKDSVTIEILRNEKFMQELIPKIEQFYMEFFLPALAGKS